MAQVNLHVTPEFEEALDALMRGRALGSKSEAIRLAVREAAAPYLAAPRRDLSLLLGLLDRHQGGEKRRRPMAALEREIDDQMERALGAPRRVPVRAGKNAA